PRKLHVWVKIINIHMEAWSVKGISALASSLGKPIIMDEMTTRMCLKGEGRIGFARVMVELSAEKEIKDKIGIIYKGKDVVKGIKKVVDVKYAWKPTTCTHCNVFGNNL
ncbi:ATPase, F1/V1/A1 complex, alpha/beta subunit, partial [Tanacetum coccineum]